MLRLFLPEICTHCGDHCNYAKQNPLSKYLCAICLRQFELFEPPPKEMLVAKSNLFGELPFDIQLGAAFEFQNEGIIQSLLHHAKYQDMPTLATKLGAIAATKNFDISDDYDFLVPIPLHRTRYSERGYNQSEKISYGISELSKILVAKRNWLKRTRQTPSQTGLTLEEREENVRGAFALTKKGMKELEGKRILIIDDVMTTGATLASAANALAIAKPRKVDLFALAAVIDI